MIDVVRSLHRRCPTLIVALSPLCPSGMLRGSLRLVRTMSSAIAMRLTELRLSLEKAAARANSGIVEPLALRPRRFAV